MWLYLQADVDYRREWDSLIIKLDIIERDPSTGSEVVQWIMKFPVGGAYRYRSVDAMSAVSLKFSSSFSSIIWVWEPCYVLKALLK